MLDWPAVCLDGKLKPFERTLLASTYRAGIHLPDVILRESKQTVRRCLLLRNKSTVALCLPDSFLCADPPFPLYVDCVTIYILMAF